MRGIQRLGDRLRRSAVAEYRDGAFPFVHGETDILKCKFEVNAGEMVCFLEREQMGQRMTHGHTTRPTNHRSCR